MPEVIIGLGSNVGDREKNLREAIASLGRETEILDVSPVYETEPMYYSEQPSFLNCVVVVRTELEPEALLALVKRLEGEMGRVRTGPRFGPRTIDMDILLYGERVVRSDSLEIPHPRMAERAFVLAPLADVRPQLVHPVLRRSVAQLYESLRTEKKVVKRRDLDLRPSASQPRRSSPPARSPSRRAS